jgi:hypothetical protein
MEDIIGDLSRDIQRHIRNIDNFNKELIMNIQNTNEEMLNNIKVSISKFNVPFYIPENDFFDNGGVFNPFRE